MQRSPPEIRTTKGHRRLNTRPTIINYEVIIVQFRNLRGIREDRDIKQKDIAKYLCVSQNTYSQYETGVISLTAEVLIKLADYYDVSIDYLLDRTDNPNMQKKP